MVHCVITLENNDRAVYFAGEMLKGQISINTKLIITIIDIFNSTTMQAQRNYIWNMLKGFEVSNYFSYTVG